MAETLTRKWRTRYARAVNTNLDNVTSVTKHEVYQGPLIITCAKNPNDGGIAVTGTFDPALGTISWA